MCVITVSYLNCQIPYFFLPLPKLLNTTREAKRLKATPLLSGKQLPRDD